MKSYLSMTAEELSAEFENAKEELQKWDSMSLTLDMTRGKPGQVQLDLSSDMLGVISERGDCFSESGTDCRNYGILDGLPEAKRLFGELLGIPQSRIMVFGNSSLNIMFDTVVRCLLFGVAGGAKPWGEQGKIKFLCPCPGYDRHFTICKTLGIEMIPVKMNDDGPDMDEVCRLAESDPAVKGIWCTPKYQNPTGITFSKEVVRRFAAMNPAADDFRIFWDNAYAVHDLYDEGEELADIFSLAEEYGHEDNVFYFASTSKITFPGSGVAIMAASERNIEQIKPILASQTIGYDKINQMRHVKYFKNAEGIREHMKKHAAIIRPKFEIVKKVLTDNLAGLEIAKWTNPVGGYFLSLDVLPGTAKEVFRLAKSVGVKLTTVGATFPYGIDPDDTNLRIAPTFPETEDVKTATEVLSSCIRYAACEKLLGK